ncbi:MAG: WG repeat-containing protein, partial [Saprospiraceae bacterium]|nr:WG repeat-containing protein [Saprospiraceae bacterium]
MKNHLTGLFLALFCQTISAQTLLPFLSQNGKYGFADEAGKIVFAPEFEGQVEPFWPNTMAINCKKNGQTIRLFRSGLQLPNPHLMMGRVLPVLNHNENNVRLDSFGHMAAVRVEQKIQIIDL